MECLIQTHMSSNGNENRFRYGWWTVTESNHSTVMMNIDLYSKLEWKVQFACFASMPHWKLAYTREYLSKRRMLHPKRPASFLTARRILHKTCFYLLLSSDSQIRVQRHTQNHNGEGGVAPAHPLLTLLERVRYGFALVYSKESDRWAFRDKRDTLECRERRWWMFGGQNTRLSEFEDCILQGIPLPFHHHS